MEEEIRTRLDRKQYVEAFDSVLRHYQQKVFRLAYSMIGNRALAEEAAQEIFIRIWRGLPGYRGAASVSTWVFTIARNACLSALRVGAGRRTLSLEEPEVRLAAETRHAKSARETRDPDVLALVARLPEKYRQVIVLFYLEEKSYEEVARLLDLPMGTVKTYLHRARKELVSSMKKESSDAVRGL